MTDSSSSIDERRSLVPAILSVVLGLAAIGLSALGGRVFQILAIAVTIMSAWELVWLLKQSGTHVPVVPAAAAAGFFPLLAFDLGEQGTMAAAAIVVPAICLYFVMGGMRKGVLTSLGGTLFVSFYMGVLSAYLVLLRMSSPGTPLIATLVVMFAGYRLGRWLGDTRLRGPVMSSVYDDLPRWWGAIAGAVGAMIGSLAALLIMGAEGRPAPLLGLGLIVAVTGLIGDFVASMIRSDAGLSHRQATLPGRGGLVLVVHSVLLAAPAFFFGFKLYLT